MFLSPAGGGPDAAGSGPGETSGGGLRGVGPGQRAYDGWMPAPVADASASPAYQPGPGRLARARSVAGIVIDDRTPRVGLAQASVRAGGCFVRPLPLDPTCASAARSFFRESVAGAGLPGDLVHDGLTMASELAANTLNAHGNIEYAGQGHRPVSGIPEFWLYVRSAPGCGIPGREIV